MLIVYFTNFTAKLSKFYEIADYFHTKLCKQKKGGRCLTTYPSFTEFNCSTNQALMLWLQPSGLSCTSRGMPTEQQGRVMSKYRILHQES